MDKLGNCSLWELLPQYKQQKKKFSQQSVLLWEQKPHFPGAELPPCPASYSRRFNIHWFHLQSQGTQKRAPAMLYLWPWEVQQEYPSGSLEYPFWRQWATHCFPGTVNLMSSRKSWVVLPRRKTIQKITCDNKCICFITFINPVELPLSPSRLHCVVVLAVN